MHTVCTVRIVAKGRRSSSKSLVRVLLVLDHPPPSPLGQLGYTGLDEASFLQSQETVFEQVALGL